MSVQCGYLEACRKLKAHFVDDGPCFGQATEFFHLWNDLEWNCLFALCRFHAGQLIGETHRKTARVSEEEFIVLSVMNS